MPQWSKKRRILLSKTSNNCADGEVYWWGEHCKLSLCANESSVECEVYYFR